MNILLIAVLIMLIGCIAIGYWKGFIRIACSLAAMIVTIVLVGWATPYISDFLKENTTVYEDLVEKCSETIRLSAKKETDNEKEESEKGSEETDNKEESADSGKIGGIQLPKLWVEQILQETGDSLDQVMEENDIYRKAGEYIAEWIELRKLRFWKRR